MNTSQGVVAAIGCVALGAAGYFANEWRACRALEADYLSSIDSYSANVYSGALAGAVGVEVDKQEQKRLQELSLTVQKMQLMQIYERCGDDAGRSAAELASDELRESMNDILSLP